MNIAFYLLPKEKTAYLTPQATMRQALEKMEFHRFTAIPIVNQQGKYEGTLTEGDLLWKLKNTPGLSFENTHKISLTDVPQRMKVEPIRIEAQIEDLIDLSMQQNFVPIVDDKDHFIGIIRRSDIISYCKNKLFSLR
ncbi:inosine-5-monophosphate dehydrogenase [Paenibacillus montaniterrae]|uniref:Inosine-5-monophosphate dehydrogenase n=1 Tax=Paenibacillus montaniterrae TaxID=429341 RepID=A0A919YS92_9BACL|nr:CBS domain-containing protein [Paenibacillus montaniterrae]GIP17399.1 inosine-5-monophosphate dehydrogenase [Paenibacillus montaniterrae]